MEIGTRVLAVCSAKTEGSRYEVRLYGFGTYQGRSVPNEAVGWMAKDMREMGIMNPTILLDSGETIYGCECWWGEAVSAAKRFRVNNDLSPATSDTVVELLKIGDVRLAHSERDNGNEESI